MVSVAQTSRAPSKATVRTVGTMNTEILVRVQEVQTVHSLHERRENLCRLIQPLQIGQPVER